MSARCTTAVISAPSARNSVASASVIRSAARAAARPSTARRISVISIASSTEISRTRAPRFGWRSTSPSLASVVSALRRTNRLVAYCSVSSASMSRWRGA